MQAPYSKHQKKYQRKKQYSQSWKGDIGSLSWKRWTSQKFERLLKSFICSQLWNGKLARHTFYELSDTCSSGPGNKKTSLKWLQTEEVSTPSRIEARKRFSNYELVKILCWNTEQIKCNVFDRWKMSFHAVLWAWFTNKWKERLLGKP